MPSMPPSDAPKAWSLARRLTLWYTAATFALVMSATAYQYWAVTEQLDEEDDRYLLDKVAELERILNHEPNDPRLLRTTLAAPSRLPFHVRVEFADDRPSIATANAETSLPRLNSPTDGPFESGTEDGRTMRLRSVQPAGKPYRILIGMDTSADDEMLAPLRRRILYAWAASFLLAFLGGILLARRGLAPVAALSAGLRSIRPTHLDARLSTAELPRELLALGAEVNTMLARLEDAFGRLTQYSADIAHELRTPLNALHGTLEVALDRERNADDYRQTLNAAHEECTLLIRLSDDMLFLAQAENPRTHLRRETIHLHPFLETIKDLYAPSASETGITLATAVPPSLTVFADRILLQRVVVNLTANALAHTPPGGTITLFAEGTPGSILVGVRNSGNTIPVDERRAIFGRFHRGDRARTPQGGRVGLGLAIVKGIAELHGGTADAAESESGETVVRITLPHLAKVTASE